MDADKRIPGTMDEYIAQYPEDIRVQLELMRQTIRKVAPGAKEKISWGMPTFWLQGDLVHFAANKHHMGFYPGAAIHEGFTEDLKPYKTSKGTVQFPYGKPLPLELIGRIVIYRIEENLRNETARAAAKAAARAERTLKK